MTTTQERHTVSLYNEELSKSLGFLITLTGRSVTVHDPYIFLRARLDLSDIRAIIFYDAIPDDVKNYLAIKWPDVHVRIQHMRLKNFDDVSELWIHGPPDDIKTIKIDFNLPKKQKTMLMKRFKNLAFVE